MKKELCKNCNYYSAYYKQWSNFYGRLNNGYCSKKSKPQTQFESCDDFKSSEKKEKTREKRRLLALDQAINSLNEIAHILKEKEKDKKLE